MQDPKNKSFTKMAKEKVEAANAEVWRLLDAGFIREVTYPEWFHKRSDLPFVE
jgi:hypothetical protein